LGARHFLLRCLLLSRCERLATGHDCLLLGGTKAASGRCQTGLALSLLLSSRQGLAVAGLQGLRLLVQN
jgi:hypothetical protein